METHGTTPVPIFIDENRYESPNPTTGEALYRLGQVAAGQELYREVTGDRDDPAIVNGPEVVHLKEHDHFHSGRSKLFTIIVNGRKKEVTTKELSFDQVVALAYNPVPTGGDIMFTVTYEHGPRANPEGILAEGKTVEIKNGMIFNVKHTNRS